MLAVLMEHEAICLVVFGAYVWKHGISAAPLSRPRMIKHSSQG